MIKYIIKRILLILPTLFIVTVITFALIQLIPGGPAYQLLGINATMEQVNEINQKLGLDKPLLEQYGVWIGNILKGDLGTSFFFRESVSSLIAQRIPQTLELTFTALVISLLLGIPAGVLAAIHQGKLADQAILAVAMVGVAMPEFWLGMALITLFAVPIAWLPTGGYTSLAEGFVPWLQHILLPALSLGFIFTAVTARMTRSSMLDVLHQDYIKTARAKGQFEKKVLSRHALRNAMIPIMTVIGISISSMIGGVVIIEEIFSIPGMGRLLIGAISKRDYPLIQGCILVIACIVIFVNLLVDILYKVLDPKISLDS